VIRVGSSAIRISLRVRLSRRGIVRTPWPRIACTDWRSWRQLAFAFRNFSIQERQQYSAREQESNDDPPGQRKME